MSAIITGGQRTLRMKPLVGIEFVFPCLFLSPGAPPLLSCLRAGARPRQCVWSKTRENLSHKDRYKNPAPVSRYRALPAAWET